MRNLAPAVSIVAALKDGGGDDDDEGGLGGGESTDPFNAEPQTLILGQPVTIAAPASNTGVAYKVEVPAGLSKLVISTSGGAGNVDLYVRYGQMPTRQQFDHRPFAGGNNESATYDNPKAGTYFFVGVAFQAYAGVTLLAEGTEAGQSDQPTGVKTQNGEAVVTSSGETVQTMSQASGN